MIVPSHAADELDVPDDPEWLSNGLPYALAKVDTGQFVVTFYKNSNRVIHVRAEDVIQQRKAGTEIPISPSMSRPLPFFFSWDNKGIRLLLEGAQPLSLPWQASPQPHRP